MTTYNHEIGRQVTVGLGFEPTPGTSVAPSIGIRLTSADFADTAKFADSTAGIGRVEDSDDQALVEQSSTGKLAGNVGDISIGYPLAGIFGSWSSALHASETTVYDATFTTNQSVTPPTQTIVRKDTSGVGSNKRFALGTYSDFELDAKAGGYATWTSTVVAKKGVTGTDTIAYPVTENLFNSKHVSIAFATNLAGLSGATALPAISLKIKIERKATAFTPLGNVDPATFNTGAWIVTGEFVLPYDSNTQHDNVFNNAIQALQIQLKNSDVTIGSASNPTLTFTAPKARLNTWTLGNNLDQRIDQTVGFKCELDLTSGYMLQAVLTNKQATYA